MNTQVMDSFHYSGILLASMAASLHDLGSDDKFIAGVLSTTALDSAAYAKLQGEPGTSYSGLLSALKREGLMDVVDARILEAMKTLAVDEGLMN